MESAAVRILALLGLEAVAASVVLLCAGPLVVALDSALKKWRRMGFVPRVVSVLMAAVATVEAQKKCSNVGMSECSNVNDSLSTFKHSNIQTFKHYFSLKQVITNDSYSYSMPASAVRYPNWWMRGGYEDVFKLELGDWRFPIGTNLVDYLWVYIWGRVRPRLKAKELEIAAVGSPISAVPQVSEFWYADGTNGSKILTWHNFFVGRIPLSELNGSHSNCLTQSPQSSLSSPLSVSAQLELFANGDYIARSNNVERYFKRVNPDDWDDDGIPNDIDANPEGSDGDFFGPDNDLPEGANSSNYCWVEVAVSNANSLVTFTGDKTSNLPDPRFVAKAGESYAVNLLIGKTYRVTSAQPIRCTAKSSNDIIVDQDDERSMTIVYPVSYEIVDNARSVSRQVRMVPPLVGTFNWYTNTCACHADIDTDSFYLPECFGACVCYSCSPTGFDFHYEGYTLSFDGVECGCSPHVPDEEDDGPYAASASVSFSKKAIIFEDAYENKPGESVPKKSKQAVLSCVAHGGPNGGRAVFTLANAEKLVRISGVELPIEVDVPAGHKVAFDIVYEGGEASGIENDVVATAQFIDNEEGDLGSMEDELTVVEVELRVVKTAVGNPDGNRHTYAIAEDIQYIHKPQSAQVVWSFPSSFIERVCGVVMCPWSIDGLTGDITASIAGVKHIFDYVVMEPQIEVCNPRVNAVLSDVNPVIGEAGHLLLYLDLYVKPFYVSFEELEICESPDDSQSGPHYGYFDDRTKGGNWSHTAADGAGAWNIVQSSGYYATDKAGRRSKYEEPWTYGWKEWDIPMEWGICGLAKGRFKINPTTQKFVLYNDGTFEIIKFGHKAVRDVGGLMWRNGDPVW